MCPKAWLWKYCDYYVNANTLTHVMFIFKWLKPHKRNVETNKRLNLN